MLKEDYIFFDVDVKTKEEALRFISNQAQTLGLTDKAEGLYGDFVKREEEFSTGLQDGFAIPHAKSDYAKETAILFVSCKENLDWETMDDKPVNYLFALIVPTTNAGNEHLMMISKLATSLLDDDFKEAVKASTNKTQLKEYILDKMKEESV
ncbi:MAG: PTS sugar transporter subunit IIA [Lachnospiraceae bacterium]|nr:PTS sugar transporter subunit IIA [Lachnospiraceae bacterium]